MKDAQERRDALWRRRPGDVMYRPARIKRQRLRRVLGVAALYSAGYGNVGSSIYYALGIVALVALGATPIALGIAGLFFVFTALTYAEGTAMFPEAGGSASFARHAFNELMGFIAGWALMLSYIVTIALSAFTIPPYLGLFWPVLKESDALGTAAAMAIVAFLLVLNIIGIRETSLVNIAAALLDLTTQSVLVVAGLLLLFDPLRLGEHIFGPGNWPSLGGLISGVAIAALAYTGVETVSQMAEEARRPEQRVPRALVLMVVTVLLQFSGISVAALSAMPSTELATTWAKDPVAGIANSMPLDWLRGLLKPLVALLAATILLIATNAGLIGVSRLSFSLAQHQQIPPLFSRVHHRFRTPWVAISFFAGVAILILLPGLFFPGIFENLGALYTFGSLLAFALAHASILALRVRQPELPRPFKLGLNISFQGRQIPLTALLGFLATFTIWVVVTSLQPYSRWLGPAWMLAGLALYGSYRKRQGLSLTKPAKSESHG